MHWICHVLAFLFLLFVFVILFLVCFVLFFFFRGNQKNAFIKFRLQCEVLSFNMCEVEPIAHIYDLFGLFLVEPKI